MSSPLSHGVPPNGSAPISCMGHHSIGHGTALRQGRGALRWAPGCSVQWGGLGGGLCWDLGSILTFAAGRAVAILVSQCRAQWRSQCGVWRMTPSLLL